MVSMQRRFINILLPTILDYNNMYVCDCCHLFRNIASNAVAKYRHFLVLYVPIQWGKKEQMKTKGKFQKTCPKKRKKQRKKRKKGN